MSRPGVPRRGSRRRFAFATKPQLGLAMPERALDAGVPFAWVAADSVLAQTLEQTDTPQ